MCYLRHMFLHPNKELRKCALSTCWLMTQPVRRLRLILWLTEVLRVGRAIMLLIFMIRLKKGPWIFTSAASWGIRRMSWITWLCQLSKCITCIVIKILKDDKFRRCQCQAVQQLCYLSARKADNLQHGLHTNRVLILAFFLDSHTKQKQSSSVISSHHCFHILPLICPCVKLHSTEITLHPSPLIYTCWTASEIKMTQHCMISVIKPGSDVSKSSGITSQTIESWLHVLAYNWFVLDLINSVVAWGVLVALVFMQEGVGESMRSSVYFSALPLLPAAANIWDLEQPQALKSIHSLFQPEKWLNNKRLRYNLV